MDANQHRPIDPKIITPKSMVPILLFLATSVSAQPLLKTRTSQYPYGSCGIKNAAHLSPAISPYQPPVWSSDGGYYTLNMTKRGCRDRGASCGSRPCLELCKEALGRVDAFHVPIDSSCLLPTVRVTGGPCAALVSNNQPGAARYRTSLDTSWTPVSMDLNSCDGVVTQARINTKGVAFGNETWLQFGIPRAVFSCKGWKDICRSANSYSTVPFCAVAPYLNSGTGAHEFCPVLPSIV